jgi:Rps23 Pro-64 3,4-dihydroxylase Tpa1-like proline 4-hydroxylase
MPDPVLFLEEFFAPAELTALRAFAAAHEAGFVASEVLDDHQAGYLDQDVRRSRVLFDIAEIYPLVAERVLACFPWVMARLGQEPFHIRDIELQVTLSGDGEWFKAHRDSGHGAVGSRTLTFVYYCHSEPRMFSGGELRMFGPVPENRDADDPQVQAQALTITPPQNSVVFFPSHYLHEVMPVSCPSGRFADSRLTFNGWLHR